MGNEQTATQNRAIAPELWQSIELTYNGQDADRTRCVFHPDRQTYVVVASVPTCRECYDAAHKAAIAATGRTNLARGFARQWLRCRTCGRIQFRDHQPHALANPVTWTICGHGLGERDLGCDRITAEEARGAFIAEKGETR